MEVPDKSEHLTVARGGKIGGVQDRTGYRHEQTEVDPLHVMRAIGFSRLLRDTKHFSDAMQAAHEFECGDTGDMEVERDSSDDPSRHALQLVASRLDLADCLLHRREFQADYEHDTLFAINAFSDGSPSSGEELQGMVIDVFRRHRDPERITLPGSTLPYSRFDAVSKTIALLHAFWLIAGPNFQTLSYVLSKVISITTEFGTEKNIVTMLNCVLACCLWTSGAEFPRCRDFVDKDHRWLPNALRVSAWSHSIGNVARNVAESHPEWPRYLLRVRTLVSFLRNATWRKWIKRAITTGYLHERLPQGLDLDVLDRFICTIAKWRYETIAHAIACFFWLRSICKLVRIEWFASAQDKGFVGEALRAMNDEDLWTFMVVASKEILDELETYRHLGYDLRMRCTYTGPTRMYKTHHLYVELSTFAQCMASNARLRQCQVPTGARSDFRGM